MTALKTFDRNSLGALRELLSRYRHLYRTSSTLGLERRVPHPGDVLYWIGAVGAMGALLFVTMR
jgi:hypothetical protein